MGESWETRRAYMGDSRGIALGLPGASSASAGPRNIIQAYGQRAEGSFSVFGPLFRPGAGETSNLIDAGSVLLSRFRRKRM